MSDTLCNKGASQIMLPTYQSSVQNATEVNKLCKSNKTSGTFCNTVCTIHISIEFFDYNGLKTLQ